jgi:hypothetical protein
VLLHQLVDRRVPGDRCRRKREDARRKDDVVNVQDADVNHGEKRFVGMGNRGQVEHSPTENVRCELLAPQDRPRNPQQHRPPEYAEVLKLLRGAEPSKGRPFLA